MTLERIGIVGAGLIGTSIGLALRRLDPAPDVLVVDVDEHRAASAAALGAGAASRWDDLRRCTHVVVAVPPRAISAVLGWLQDLDVEATISDTCSIKADVIREVETMGAWASRFCGGHPIAGRERGGPGNADPALFDHATWAITPCSTSSQAAVDDAAGLAGLCGARAVTVSSGEHDAVLAAVSHLPQVVASALASDLPEAGPLAPSLAGPGFRDTTRLAEGDPSLWTDILLANGPAVADGVDRLSVRLAAIADALRRGLAEPVSAAIRSGNAARALLPGKATAAGALDWSWVGVVLADRPGELARLLAAAGEAEVNVEDVRIEHAADHPVGFVELAVSAERAEGLLDAVRTHGWAAHIVR